jgi:hypothetical protein
VVAVGGDDGAGAGVCGAVGTGGGEGGSVVPLSGMSGCVEVGELGGVGAGPGVKAGSVGVNTGPAKNTPPSRSLGGFRSSSCSTCKDNTRAGLRTLRRPDGVGCFMAASSGNESK